MRQKAIIYTKSLCPYCVHAKNLLDNLGIKYIELSLDNDPALKNEMIKKTNKTSVPQTFIGEDYIGGCDDLYANYDNGGLSKYIK
jgi:glutaredoxin 3